MEMLSVVVRRCQNLRELAALAPASPVFQGGERFTRLCWRPEVENRTK